mmetsp:Transcript_76919/g.152269  ORF Transcript_76919/g.152269 Transcript_76919/m.152269 type:complete len:183 (+) Transcript_76919:656-1204(+)
MRGAAKAISGNIRLGRKDRNNLKGLGSRGSSSELVLKDLILGAGPKRRLLPNARANNKTATNCPEAVAVAAPIVPRLRPAMRSMSSVRFTAPPTAVAHNGVTVSRRALKHAADSTSCSICNGKVTARIRMYAAAGAATAVNASGLTSAPSTRWQVQCMKQETARPQQIAKQHISASVARASA